MCRVRHCSVERMWPSILYAVMSVVCLWTVVTDADEEAFEDNAEEYMRRDVEGSGMQLIFWHLFLYMK